MSHKWAPKYYHQERMIPSSQIFSSYSSSYFLLLLYLILRAPNYCNHIWILLVKLEFISTWAEKIILSLLLTRLRGHNEKQETSPCFPLTAHSLIGGVSLSRDGATSYTSQLRLTSYSPKAEQTKRYEPSEGPGKASTEGEGGSTIWGFDAKCLFVVFICRRRRSLATKLVCPLASPGFSKGFDVRAEQIQARPTMSRANQGISKHGDFTIMVVLNVDDLGGIEGINWRPLWEC